ncbi:hypothetical protein F2P81_008310 [Scophthalmus maximus]|uniref:Alcohol dehydrogenase-like C-terminal domain-containing protein n=1 Tax=Scophthalmus maximus TaxID=52904 RepID=A0A6A4T4M6_SCOMX|nr:hypothetical protein F2P81_008310 [Scophthalmus maximus]
MRKDTETHNFARRAAAISSGGRPRDDNTCDPSLPYRGSPVSERDQVIPLFLPQCGECERCLSPKTNQCRKNWANTQMGVLADGTSRISCRGQQVYQFLGVSSFSQYTVVPDTSLAKIRSDAPLDKVCLLGCGVSTGYGAALKTGKVEKDASCAVFGLGCVGLAAVMGCRAAGARRIIGVDVNPDKFAKAAALGATECVNPADHGKPIQEVLAEMTDGGVDYALECVGSPAVMSAALESTVDAWGTCVIAGWTEREAMKVKVEQILLGRTLKGTYFGGWKSVQDVPRLVDDYMNHKLKLDEFITHNLPLDQINVAFDLLNSGKRMCGKEFLLRRFIGIGPPPKKTNDPGPNVASTAKTTHNMIVSSQTSIVPVIFQTTAS